jgi:hypothetical protein
MARKAKELNTEHMTAGQGEVKPAVEKKGRESVAHKAEALKRLVVQYVPCSTIKPNPYNPNRQADHEFELLCRSMKEDGFTQPVVAALITEAFLTDPSFKDRGFAIGDTVICDGEHRWRAAMHLGIIEIPLVYVPMAPSQMRIATLRHNRARGSEDVELTADVLRDLRDLGALDWAQESLMMDDVELDKLLEDIPVSEALAAEQYSEAWEPDKQGSTSVGTATTASMMAGHTIDGTPEALLKAREQEKRIAEAKTDEEKKAASKDSDVFRLALMFSGEEARIVKAAMGDKPALRVLEWAKAAMEAHPSAA